MKTRRPHVAGQFYSASKSRLKTEIEESFLHQYGPGRLPTTSNERKHQLVGMVSPHAGYMYSGPVAACGFFQLATEGCPETFIIIGPNHTGLGSGISIMAEGSWETPLGEVAIDSATAKAIARNASIIDIDEKAHLYEHSIEVQLPFLQYLFGQKFSFVPICMLMQDLESSCEVGDAVAKAVEGKDCIMIASSDMTHYEDHESAKRKDDLAINTMVNLQEASLQKVVESHNVTMCGYGPVTATIRAAKELNATRATLIAYRTSGEVTGDKGSVVGYASVSFSK